MNARGGALLERDEELETIARQLDLACGGEGTLTVVEGPAGIGKTRLLDAGAEMGRERGMTVVRARGGVLEQELDFAVVRQLLDRELAAAEPQRLEALMRGPAAPAAAVLGLPVPAPGAGPGHDPSADILHALHWVAVNLSEDAPLLMVVDDAHWADASSLRAAGYMSARLEGVSAAFFVATRDDEPGSNRELMPALFAGASPVLLRPGLLSEGSVTEVLRRQLGADPADELVRACARTSGGNPFFLTELAHDLGSAHEDPASIAPEAVEGGEPVAVRRYLVGRLDRLGPDARALAEALAVLGGEGELDHAAAIAGLAAAAAGRRLPRWPRRASWKATGPCA